MCSLLQRISSCQGKPFRLNIPVVVFCIGWCVLFIALTTECLDEKLEVAEERGERIVDVRSVYNVVLFYPVIIANSVGVLCYLAVSWRRPRPPILHWHGILLVQMVLLAYQRTRLPCFHGLEDYVEVRYQVIFVAFLWGVKKIILVALIATKIDALGPRLNRLVDINLWGRIINLTEVVHIIVVQPMAQVWGLSMWDRGYTPREMNIARRNLFVEEKIEVDLDPVDEIAIPVYIYTDIVSKVWFFLVYLVFLLVATIMIWHTMQRLSDRQVDSSQLKKVRIVLWQHVTGIWLVVITSNAAGAAAVWQTMRGWEIAGWEEEMRPTPGALAFLLDGVCDTLGILLLSGILGLLFREQADGGDVSAYIRGILHSAVLTSRAETAFEGRVARSPSNLCLVSFPGKYPKEWNELTWFCERAELSSACVFLPQNDPHQRFGRHEENPDTPGQCWCHSMYGVPKPWGCAWFTAWMANVEMAVRLRLELVVVFFPSETNQGIVDWADLPTANLWDGVGLGGSQKVEVAWLNLKGYQFSSEDINVTRRRFDRQRLGNNGPTASISSNSLSARQTPSTATPSSRNLWGFFKN